MNYESMVKEAYEEILGLEKEAAPKKKRIEKDLEYFNNSDVEKKIADNIVNRNLIRKERADVLAQMKDLKRQGKKDSDEYATLKGKNSKLKRERNKTVLSQMNPLRNMAASYGRMAASPGLYFGNMGSAHDMNNAYNDFVVDRFNKAKAEKKAAAYYEEAQLVKEAAEADYAEACAYEEAALSILEELGYFED